MFKFFKMILIRKLAMVDEIKQQLMQNYAYRQIKFVERVKNAKQNPKSIYAYMNSKIEVKNHIRALKKEGSISTDGLEIANILNGFFNLVFL